MDIQTINELRIIAVKRIDKHKGSPVLLHKQLYGPPLNGPVHKSMKPIRRLYLLHGRPTRMKAIYGRLHTHQWKERIHSTSPTCPLYEEVESNDHIWMCPATTTNRQEVVNLFMLSIKERTPTET